MCQPCQQFCELLAGLAHPSHQGEIQKVVVCQVMWYNNNTSKDSDTVYGLIDVLTYFLSWGCRVSTGDQIVELQAEVSVSTLVKQPTKQ